MEIKITELLEISEKYKNVQKKGGYYSRLDNFCKIYDYFFIKLYNSIEKSDIKKIESELKNNILKCSSENYDIIKMTKPNHFFSKRIVIIPNFYDVLFYEAIIHKIIKEVINIFGKNKELKKYLIDDKYISFAHRINFQNEKIIYENYKNGWKKYENKKEFFLKEKKFYLETDIKSFYDNIDHNNLIEIIKNFIEKNNSDLSIKELNYLLFNFNKILFKVSGFKRLGIPQGLLSSDILSQLYLWLILYFESIDSNSEITFKNGTFKLEKGKVLIVSYSDDIILFSDSDKSLYKGFIYLNNILGKNKLYLNYSKTTIIKKTEEYEKIDININKIIEGELEELEKLFELIIIELSKDFLEIDIKNLKTLFKFFYQINLFEEEIQKDILKQILKKIKFKEINGQKKIALLIIISSKNFCLFLEKGKLIDKKIEENFIFYFLKDYNLFLSEINLLFIYRYLNNFKAIQSKIKEIILKSDSLIIKNFFFTKKKLSKSFIKNKFYGLNNLFYGFEDKIEENSIGIKLENLFNIDLSLTSFLKNNLFLYEKIKIGDKKEKIIEKILDNLNIILDNLLFLKKMNKHFYLEEQGFIADFHSLINIILTILHSLEKGEYEIVKISSKQGILNNKNNIKINYGEIVKKIIKEYDLFIVYVVEFRAKLNHKEVDKEINNNMKVKSFNDYHTLFLNMKSFLNDVLKEIKDLFEQ